MTSLNPPSAASGAARNPADVRERERTSLEARFEAVAWPAFGVAAAIAAVLILWLGRGRTLSADEMIWFMQTPGLDLGGAFEPHVGHLILTTRLVYQAIFSVVGVDYLSFQLLTIAAVILTAGLFFAYAGRRIGKLAAFAPTLVLLVFGSDPAHLLSGNGFTVIGALACGLGALLALDRGDLRGDVIACALLCLGVVTYTVALPFVVGVAVAVALRGDRWRRAWIVAIPLVVYAAWWIWALGSDASSESQLAIDDALFFPSWAFQSASAGLGALAGLDFDFTDVSVGAGPTLALIALAGLVWRIARGGVPAMLWGALALAVTLWLMGTISTTSLRVPDSDRYLYPNALAVLIIGAWAAAGFRWRRPALIALGVLAVSGVLTNVGLLRDGGEFNRVAAKQQRAILAGIEIAGGNANPAYVPEDAPFPISFSFGGENTTGAYLVAAADYGSIGYPADELAETDELLRARADRSLFGALGLALAPADAPGSGPGCVELGAESGQVPSVELPPGATVVLESDGAAAVQVGRFADSSGIDVGSLQPGEPQGLSVPADGLSDPWRVTAAAPARACVSA